MSQNARLQSLGAFQSLLFRLPLLGNPVVRGLNRAVAYAAFYTPVVGGKRATTIADVKKGWLAFLERAGVTPVVTADGKMSFQWEVEACPYGFCKAEQRGVCDAVMDMDRTYTKLLGGELVIHDRLADGADRCRFTTKLRA